MAWQNAGWASEQATKEPGTVVFKGFINVPGDFPLVDNRDIGDMYHVNNDVTDPYPPGQSFLAGQNIKWLGSLWTISDSEQIWKDDTLTISKIFASRDVDLSNGYLITTDVIAKSALGLNFYNDASELALKITDDQRIGIRTDTLSSNDIVKVLCSSLGGNRVFTLENDGGNGYVSHNSNNDNAMSAHCTGGAFNQITSTASISIRANEALSKILTGTYTAIPDSAHDLYIEESNNYVGIGTGLPSSKLHIIGNIQQNGAVTVSDAASINDEAEISLTAFGDTVGCYGEVFIEGSPSAIATFTRDSDNSITLISATAGVFSLTDTDGYFVIYNSTNILTLKNRLGASKDIIYRVYKG